MKQSKTLSDVQEQAHPERQLKRKFETLLES